MKKESIAINITVISSRVDFIKAVFSDCIDSMTHVLKNLGYEVYVTENTVVDEIVNIVWGVGTHYSKEYGLYSELNKKYKVIFMNMEQLGGGSKLLDDEYFTLLTQNRFMDYCYSNIAYLNKVTGITSRSQEFPFAPIPLSLVNHNLEKKYDFAFFGADNSRRTEVINKLISNGFNIKLIKGKYTQALSDDLLDCSAVLNIHYYESSIFEVARCLRPVSMQIPILSETSHMPNSVDWGNAGIQFFELNQLVSVAQNFLDEENLKILSEKSISFIRENQTNKLDLNILHGW